MISTILQALRCRFDRHRPEQGKVFWDGLCYVGRCEHCSMEIRRAGRKRWLRDEFGGSPGLA
ncbi:hypothetical protein EDF58_108139 [Novosphingobium sp. PhB57]|uniref:hypothetical protein n=1 Tax=Novosphingobium sp. PhB57 TaxID=2485107 RepID=UPI0010525FBA|nr:hypothetical protein [Novosphingobium sp. PhB57]TCU54708.1 hypothetical protein EDF58_108139 [Novosphingobium sp. PhB57]